MNQYYCECNHPAILHQSCDGRCCAHECICKKFQRQAVRSPHATIEEQEKAQDDKVNSFYDELEKRAKEKRQAVEELHDSMGLALVELLEEELPKWLRRAGDSLYAAVQYLDKLPSAQDAWTKRGFVNTICNKIIDAQHALGNTDNEEVRP